MKLIKLTLHHGYDVYIDAQKITFITTGDNGTAIYFLGESKIVVSETIATVLTKVSEATS